ncbi:hypothetical protein [Rhizobium ruizarguesonis]|uniref:hypothetical protein n=1 Tax=Rhizobium ruizarguesonis TaxID=2081791 RepID=UPI001031D676|nr:hypothetical protein [Rhizobium ruizarguesonis]TBF30717.1 hypothetical protein ELG93_10435 [Rhizobium ruizarguesonis]
MRTTIADLISGTYDYDGHSRLADRGFRRYHTFSFDFDSTPINLEDPEEHWDEQAKNNYAKNRAQEVERLKLEHGGRHIEMVIKNTIDLGPKSMSFLSYHNALHEQARRSFVTGAYYPALVAACALGERILNHLVLDLRDSFKASPHYKKVYRKDSFDYWPLAVTVLTDWEVLANGVEADFLALGDLRNRSIHFNPDTYQSLRGDALTALHRLDKIIAKQFGYFGRQPWFIENTPGAQFIKRDYETHPFVRIYIIPRSGFVGPLYGMELTPEGHWQHLDHADYGGEGLTDEAFATRVRERNSKNVVTREMIEQNRKSAG